MSETTLSPDQQKNEELPTTPDNILGTDFAGEPETPSEVAGSKTSVSEAEEVGMATQFDPSQFDWIQGNVNDIPEQYRPLQNIARKMQSSVTRKQQDLSTQLEQARQLQEQFRAQSASAVPQAATQPQTQAEKDALAAYKERYGIPAELAADFDRSVELVRAVNRVDQAGQAPSVNEEKFNRVVQALHLLANRVNQVQAQPIAKEVEQLNAEFHDDPDNYAEQIASLMKVQNHETGQPFTMREAYLFASGKTAELAKGQRETHERVRSTAKQQTRPEPASRSAIPDAESMTEEQAQQVLKDRFNLE